MTNDNNDKTNNKTNDSNESAMPAPGAPVAHVDDPRLTAFALGELDGDDSEAVERFLETSDEARALVDETRAFAGVLREELADEDAPRLAPEQRQALAAALEVQPVNGRRKGSRGAVLRLWLTSAAAIVLGVLTWRLATDGPPAVGQRGLRPEGPVATLDERASGANYERRVSLGEDLLGTRNDGVTFESEANAAGRTSTGSSKALHELGYAGKQGNGQASTTLSEEAGDDTVLVMYDVRDLTQTTAGQSTQDYNLLPSGTDGEATPVAVPGSIAARGKAAGLGLAGETPRRAAAKQPLTSAAAPSRTPAAPSEQLRLLKALGYISAASVDADADSYGIDLRYSQPYTPTAGGESYAPLVENPFTPLTQDRYSALSTFGIDVDTASYSNARRFLNRNQAPPPDAVRLEEFINAFDYDLPAPEGEHPFSVTVDAATAPWAPRHRLVRIGLKGVEFDEGERPASNLVFLLDVSGSMNSDDKLPLLVASLKMLVEQLTEDDRVAIVTYASGTRLALPSTSGADKRTIVDALDSLAAGGSTNASDGIQKAYGIAVENFVEGGTNRVLLATDGDFNVGITQNGALETFITEKARSGVFLTVLGFGTGNLQDSKAEILADRGNGNYAYIDTLNEAHKVLVREMGGTLVTIAKDVKIQVEFNPAHVAAFRLLGYENRALAAQDFRDDKKDAGEIGAGHTVTALYEIVPVGAESLPGAVELRYQAAPPAPEVMADSPELLTVNVRYKLPDGDTGIEFAVPFVDGEQAFEAAAEDFRFAAAVASFGMVLRHSAHRGDVDLATIYEWAAAAQGEDPHGDRAEFLRLVRNAQGLPGY